MRDDLYTTFISDIVKTSIRFKNDLTPGVGSVVPDANKWFDFF